MSDINAFVFTGRLTKDATMRTLATGKKLLVADVAINTGYGDFKKTLFIKVQMWGDRGEKILPYLKKGQLIGTNGELSRNEWGDEGNKRVDLVVDIMNMNLLGSAASTSTVKKATDSESIPSDDLVF